MKDLGFITKRDLGAKLFRTEILSAIHISKLFEKVQPSLAKLFLHQNCRLCVQRARSFNDHHQGLRESLARTESYGESRAKWQSGRQWQRWRFEKWSFSELVWYLFIYGVIGVWLVEIRRRKKKSQIGKEMKLMCTCTWAFLASLYIEFSSQFSPHFGEKTFWWAWEKTPSPHHFFFVVSPPSLPIKHPLKIFYPLFSHQFFIFPKIPPNKHTLKLARLPTLAKFSI